MPGLEKRSMSQITGKAPMKKKKKVQGIASAGSRKIQANVSPKKQKFQSIRG
jgi:hypothetical protein